MNRRRAFTLPEVLVVVGLVALLVAVLLPSLGAARALSRAAVCAGNLHQIALAFKAAAGARAVPDPRAWPGVPQNTVGQQGIYLCPEVDDTGMLDITQYEVWLRDEGMYITFEDTSAVDGLCKVIDKGDYVEYWFDDGYIRDLDDFLFHVTKTTPRVATFRPDLAGRGIGRIVSLCYQRQVVSGWEDLKAHAAHDSFTLESGGGSHYGINTRLTGRAGPETVVLLDYSRLWAHDGEDVAASLRDSARHLGRLNVLRADFSVGRHGPTELDPAMHPGWWQGPTAP